MHLTWKWSTKEEAAQELQTCAQQCPQFIVQQSVVLPFQLLIAFGPAKPKTMVLEYQNKAFGCMWIVPETAGPFVESWINMCTFILGSLWQREQEAARQEVIITTVFHEIRNPLTAILNATELLPKSTMLTLIENNATHLLRVSTDLLELFRLRQRRVTLHREPVAFRNFFHDSSNVISTTPFQSFIHPSVPEILLLDVTKYRQVLTNLIANAAKFRATLIVVRVAWKKDWLYTEVTDNGPGIPETQQTKLFHRLGQSETGGFGIGLYLCRKLVQLMGGQILLKQSKPQQGTTFAFSFPCSRAEKISTPLMVTAKPLTTTTTSSNILIVDDHDAVRETLQQMILKQYPHCHIQGAIDGEDALQKCQTTPFRIIFMDLRMPRKNGWQAASDILQQFPEMKIIAISAFMLSESEKQFCAQVGMVGFIQKPFRMTDVSKLLTPLL